MTIVPDQVERLEVRLRKPTATERGLFDRRWIGLGVDWNGGTARLRAAVTQFTFVPLADTASSSMPRAPARTGDATLVVVCEGERMTVPKGLSDVLTQVMTRDGDTVRLERDAPVTAKALRLLVDEYEGKARPKLAGITVTEAMEVLRAQNFLGIPVAVDGLYPLLAQRVAHVDRWSNTTGGDDAWWRETGASRLTDELLQRAGATVPHGWSTRQPSWV